jgi:predicted ester cyclase
MTAEENKEIVRHQFELLNAGDAKGAAALWATDSYNHGRKVDAKQLESVYESLNLLQERHAIHEMIAEGEWVAVRTTCAGIHTARISLVNSGIFADIEPTMRKYNFQHIHLFRIVGGKIMEHWANRDDLSAARQVGLELRPASE